MYLFIVMLCWLQQYPDCRLTPVERRLIEHYLCYEGGKLEYPLTFVQKASMGTRVLAVRAETALYIDLPLMRTRVNPPRPPGDDFYREILRIDPRLIPPAGAAYGWNPGEMQSSFDWYLKTYEIHPDQWCLVRMPPRIEAWRPTPPGPLKKAFLDAMVREARKEIPSAALDLSMKAEDAEWWLLVEDFNVDDPQTGAAILDSKTGRFELGLFKLSSLEPDPVVIYERMMGTDLQLYKPQEIVGTNPIKLKLTNP